MKTRFCNIVIQSNFIKIPGVLVPWWLKKQKKGGKNETVGFSVFCCFVNHDFHLCLGHAGNGNQAAANNCQNQYQFFGDTLVFHPQPGAGS
jgi:hypothetical protein